MMPALFLVHGWGYEARFWDSFLHHFPSTPAPRWDEGYGGAPYTPAFPETPYWAIGHSAGVMQLLNRPLPGCQGILAINGFVRFTQGADFPEGIPRRVLERMHRQLVRFPHRVLADFRTLCGDDITTLPARLDEKRLQEGLRFLQEGDARPALHHLTCPLYSLTGHQDPLSPARHGLPEPAQAFSLEGGHLLPLSHAAECATLLQHLMTRPDPG